MTNGETPAAPASSITDHPASTKARVVITVLVADESRQIGDNIRRRLQSEHDMEVTVTVQDGESAVQEALRTRPRIAVIDTGLPAMDGVQTTEMLAQLLPDTGVIMMSMEAENDAYRRAMLAGAREFLQKPFKGDDLVAAVRRVLAFQARKAGRSDPPPPPLPTPSAPAAAAGRARAAAEPPAASPAAAARPRGAVTTLVSAKGGVGRSVVAANLAVLVAGAEGGAAIVDLSLRYGDIGALLNLHPDRSIADALAAGVIADAEAFDLLLLRGPAGVRALLAPPSPELAEYVTPAHIRAILDRLVQDCAHVVVDTGVTLDDVTLSALDASQRVLLVTDLSVTGLKNARLLRGILQTLGVGEQRLVVVGNHRDGAGELDRAAAENFLGAPITVEIPHDPLGVAGSIARGMPLVLDGSAPAVAAALRTLAGLVAPLSQPRGDAPETAASGDRKRRGRRVLGFSRG